MWQRRPRPRGRPAPPPLPESPDPTPRMSPPQSSRASTSPRMPRPQSPRTPTPVTESPHPSPQELRPHSPRAPTPVPACLHPSPRAPLAPVPFDPRPCLRPGRVWAHPICGSSPGPSQQPHPSRRPPGTQGVSSLAPRTRTLGHARKRVAPSQHTIPAVRTAQPFGAARRCRP